MIPTCSFAERVVVSNAPETITSSGVLYKLDNFNGRARIIIHHKNMQFTDVTNEGNQLRLIITPANKKAKVELIGGSSVSRSGYVAGANATNKYLELAKGMPSSHLGTGDAVSFSGLIEKPIAYILCTLPRYSVYSMIADIDTNAPINIQVVFGKGDAIAHGRGFHMAGLYSYDLVPIELHDKGSQTITLGTPPYLVDKTTQRVNKGNYGVDTELRLPFSLRHRKLVVSARGGRAYIVLHIIPCMGIPEGEWIIIDLQAYESVTYTLSGNDMVIKTFPISGSSYPVRLTLTGL